MSIRPLRTSRRRAARGAKIVSHIVHINSKSWAWKKPVIEAHVRTRAAENRIFVVSANVAFSPVNHASMIVGPDGIVISRISSGREQLVCAETDPSLARRAMLKRRRKDVFGRL
jgi:predicted amidohydrolase